VTSPAVQRNLGVGQLYDNSTGGAGEEDRRSRICWLERASTASPGESVIPAWLFEKMRGAAQLTQAHYGAKVTTIPNNKLGHWRPSFEAVQFAEYHPGGHYKGWHTDADIKEVDPEDRRGVSVVVLLSEPGKDEGGFTGGHFEALLQGRVVKVALRAGDAVCFPSKHLRHRVTKVKSGLRKSLVFWVSRAGQEIPSRFDSESSEEEESSSESSEEEEEEEEESSSESSGEEESSSDGGGSSSTSSSTSSGSNSDSEEESEEDETVAHVKKKRKRK
jgi:hypothetical protein